MVEFRVLRAHVSRWDEAECARALGSCKELEARIIKRLNSFKGEMIERIEESPPAKLDKKHDPE
jgi:hypothetical protein